MKTLRPIVLCLALAATHAAFADTNSNAVKMANGLNAPKVYTGVHPPQPKLEKTNAIAPRAGGNKRRVYGAPIQSPIFKSQPAKKTTNAPN